MTDDSNYNCIWYNVTGGEINCIFYMFAGERMDEDIFPDR